MVAEVLGLLGMVGTMGMAGMTGTMGGVGVRLWCPLTVRVKGCYLSSLVNRVEDCAEPFQMEARQPNPESNPAPLQHASRKAQEAENCTALLWNDGSQAVPACQHKRVRPSEDSE